jgi:DNA-binding MarR family transcriptional regulator
MEKEDQRNLIILNEIANGYVVTQRSLAQRGGIALGLTNLYLKRLVRKGYIKISTIPSSRIKYLLTPKGIAEKTRLTYEYMNYSLHLYRQARQTIRDQIKPFLFQRNKRIALYGINEATELAFLTLRELGIEACLVIDEKGNHKTFLGIPVRSLFEINSDDYDLIIIPRFGLAEEEISFLNDQCIPKDKILAF